MSYTPINWQTGDTITAEKMNKMDNGWGVSSGTRTLICEETVVTESQPPYGAVGTFSYSFEINEPQIIVTFDGVEYTCLYNSDINGYGSDDYSTFPFYIDNYDGANEIWTSTAGSYSVKIETGGATSVEVSADFISATAFHATVGVTTFQEISDALSAGRIVVVSNGGVMTFVSALDTANSPLKIYAVGANHEGATVVVYRANTADSAIYLY